MIYSPVWRSGGAANRMEGLSPGQKALEKMDLSVSSSIFPFFFFGAWEPNPEKGGRVQGWLVANPRLGEPT